MLASATQIDASRRVVAPEVPRPAKQIALVSRASARGEAHRAEHGR
jgi:hypothetical protein